MSSSHLLPPIRSCPMQVGVIRYSAQDAVALSLEPKKELYIGVCVCDW